MSKNPYAILQVSSDANITDIKAAYKRLALKYHPDVNSCENSEQMFMEIVNAYKTLLDMHNKEKESLKKEIKPSTNNNQAENNSEKATYNTNFPSKILKKISVKFKIFDKFTNLKKSKNIFTNVFEVDPAISSLSKQELIKRFHTSENKYVRSESLKALIINEKQKAYPILKKALSDISKEVRVIAIQGVGILRIRQSIPILYNLYENSSVHIKIEILEALSKINIPPIYNFIIQACFDEEKAVKLEALKIVKNLNLVKYHKEISPLLYDRDEDVKKVLKDILYG